MRIVLIHNYYQQPGGEDVVFAGEAAFLRAHGHEVFEYKEDNLRIDSMLRLSVATQTIWSRLSQQKILRLLRDTQPDVAHIHNTFLLISPAVYYTCQEVGVPVVQTLHNYRLFCPSATFYRNEKVCEDCLGKTFAWPGVFHACYRHSRTQTAVVAMMLTVHRWLRTWHEQVDIYIALTEFCREKYIQGGLLAEKIVLKPNFLYPDPGRREYEEPYALFAGRFVPAKGIQTLLRAWQDMKGILLKVAGSGPLMHEIQALIQSRKLENVELLGQLAHEEILDYLKKARFLVFPSESYENFPMAIVEAFACGVPVIAGRIGAVTELIEDGHTGLLFEPGNCEDLTAKLEWACRNPDKMQAMGNEARLEFERKYTAERNYQLLMEIYQMAIERHTKTKMDRGDDLCS